MLAMTPNTHNSQMVTWIGIDPRHGYNHNYITLIHNLLEENNSHHLSTLDTPLKTHAYLHKTDVCSTSTPPPIGYITLPWHRKKPHTTFSNPPNNNKFTPTSYHWLSHSTNTKNHPTPHIYIHHHTRKNIQTPYYMYATTTTYPRASTNTHHEYFTHTTYQTNTTFINQHSTSTATLPTTIALYLIANFKN